MTLNEEIQDSREFKDWLDNWWDNLDVVEKCEFRDGGTFEAIEAFKQSKDYCSGDFQCKDENVDVMGFPIHEKE